jgi:hypothetical protein
MAKRPMRAARQATARRSARLSKRWAKEAAEADRTRSESELMTIGYVHP